MAVIGSAAATRLHEGLGHGVIAWLRGDILPNSPAIICRRWGWTDGLEAGGTRSACGSAACRTPPMPGARARSSLTGAWYPTG